jgi:DNA gyrase subunit B
MYIGSIDSDGMHHLLLEVISNSIDEYLNGYGTKVEIKIDQVNNVASVTDDGRGIPFGKTEKGTEAMIDICTSLHSGGKFGQGGYSVSGGLHGIGLTAVNALSTYFSIVSSRDKQTATLTSSKGRDVKFGVGTLDKVFKQGTMVTFQPAKEVFGDAKFDLNKIEQTVKELSYLTAGMEFYVNGKKFISKDGIKDMIKEKVSEPITDVVYLAGEQEGYKVEVAFQYVDSRSEKIYAFTNNIPNREGGTHVTGFKTAFTNTLNKLAKQYNFIDDKDGNLNGDMMRSGIVAVVSIKMSEAPVFQGQTKEKLMTAAARGIVSQIVNAHLEKSISKKDVKLIVDRALTEQKAEEAAKRAREAAKKVASGGKNMTALKDLPSKLVDCPDRNGELWLLEGNSAAGSAKNARNPKNQAIMPLRGKVLNTHDKELADIIKNKEIKDIITALGTGIHDQFNLYNLRYGKIIILSDADSDGAHINLLLLTFFIKHMPELVNKGKIYVALPPLFKLSSGRTKQYFYSPEELEQSNIKGEVTRFKGIGEMNADELKSTTMTPDSRKIVQLSTDNLEETLDLFETLMGNSSAARKQFIVNSGLMDESIDYFGEDDE